ncbi:conserved membrane hypothetical protein [Vibrio crassostreae]|nr:conserved membrane hypothetical protein [Vibrio chagasii]CAK1736077.1 conserved membrane hypothetical protein [Vibrio crassostreae]CAK2220426.1 conserved membrane hypothetical protein [Vibrio crassostreae]CAK2391100.1 conserved membrane hypothetical protein [Vibrio crassostreae]CAK2584622.1 conserved membrane hypothetical protein [Vibrio crassostreae]
MNKTMKLLRNFLLSLLFMGSAVGVGFIVDCYDLGIPTSQSVLALGSAFCFAVATLGRLGWTEQTWKGETFAERLDDWVFYIMYWVGMYLATVSII